MTADEMGNVEKIVDVPNQPSGLGWLPNGDLIIVSMLDRKLLKFKDGNLTEHADMSKLTPFRCNDMVVDKNGNAFVGNFGSIHHGKDIKPTILIKVDPDGTPSIAASNLDFPNGTVITPDGKILIIGETYAGRLTAFDIDTNGNLSNRRIWAYMMPNLFYYYTKTMRFLKITPKEGKGIPYPVPDGICLDERMGIWIASPTTSEVVRYTEGGKITDRIATPNKAYACMLGGSDGKKLF
jgi:Gluconolactonase